MRIRNFLGLLVILVLATPDWVLAQGNSAETFELGEVVIRARQANTEKIGATTIITAEEIEAAGFRTVDQALTLVPGLHVRTAGRGIPRVDFRGLRTRQLVMLIDGVPVSSPYDNQFDPSLIGVEDIAQIKVIRGASSVLYGAGGNAGVINIITKKGRTGGHGEFNAERGENSEYLGRMKLSGGGEKINIFASGSFFDAEDYPLPSDFDDTELESGDYRTNSDRERQSLHANMIFTPQPATQLALTLNTKATKYGIPTETVSDPFTNKKPDKLDKLNYRRVNDKDGFSGQFSFSHEFTSALMVRGWTYLNSLDSTEDEYDDITFSTQAKDAYTEDQETDRYGANLQTAYDTGDAGTFTAALMGEKGKFDSTLQDVPDKGGDITRTDAETEQYSAALEYAVRPLETVGLVLGAGYHQQERSGDNDESDYSYFTGIHFDVLEHTRLKASVARKVRFPSLRELYDQKNGNPELAAENTQHYQAGVEQTFPAVAATLEIIGFRIDADDFIEKDETTNVMTNFESYRFQGVEVVLGTQAIDNLLLQASYTYLDAENRSSNAVFEELEHRPENKVTVEATYRFACGFKAYASYLFVDDRSHYDKALENVGTLDDYNIVDVKLSQSFFDNAVDVYFGARNLFDENYAESYALVREGRRIYGGVTCRF